MLHFLEGTISFNTKMYVPTHYTYRNYGSTYTKVSIKRVRLVFFRFEFYSFQYIIIGTVKNLNVKVKLSHKIATKNLLKFQMINFVSFQSRISKTISSTIRRRSELRASFSRELCEAFSSKHAPPAYSHYTSAVCRIFC